LPDLWTKKKGNYGRVTERSVGDEDLTIERWETGRYTMGNGRELLSLFSVLMSLIGFFRFNRLFVTVALPFFLNSLALAHGPDKLSESRARLASSQSVETPRFTLYFPSKAEGAGIPLDQLTKTTLSVLDETYEELSARYKIRPEQKVVFRFLTPEEFKRHTGAPAWTSAMYLRGEVSIPVSKNKLPNPTELRRAIRHEYTHAVLSELSSKNCPAWLDEGLAQMMEGDVNPLLAPALQKWAQSNDEAMPLAWLQNGFMTLDEKIVPAAYAQSLFASRMLVKKWGYPSIVTYLRGLAIGLDSAKSFRLAFGVSEKQFEQELGAQIALWAEGKVQSLRE